jgi:hypothetical protein
MDELENWRVLNQHLNTFGEEKVRALLEHEMKNRCRAMFLQRLHQRYNALRVSRERIELLAKARAV